MIFNFIDTLRQIGENQNSGVDHALIYDFSINSNIVHAVELTETQLQTNFEPIKILSFYVLSRSAQIGFSNKTS